MVTLHDLIHRLKVRLPLYHVTNVSHEITVRLLSKEFVTAWFDPLIEELQTAFLAIWPALVANGLIIPGLTHDYLRSFNS